MSTPSGTAADPNPTPTSTPTSTSTPTPILTPYWIAPAAVVIGLAAGEFAGLLAVIIGGVLGASTANPPPAVSLTGDFLFDAAFVGAALYLTVPAGWMGRSSFGYRRIPLAKGVGALVLAAAAYYLLSFGYGALVSVHGTDTLPSDLGVTHSTAAAIAAGVFVCAAAPMAEEFFFRGFLFGVLRRLNVPVGGRQLGPWVAALIVGLLFGLAHYDSAQPQFLVPLGFLGFVLCIMRWKTGSLYPCMALHAINNSIAYAHNEFHWGVGLILLVAVGSLTVITVVTGPLSRD